MSVGKPQLLQYTSLGTDSSKDSEGNEDYILFLENIKECGHSFMIEMLNEDGSLITHKYDDDDDLCELCQNTSYCSIQKNGYSLETKTSVNPRDNQSRQEDGSLNTCSLIQRNKSQPIKEDSNTSDCFSLESRFRFKKKSRKSNAKPRANQIQHHEGLLNRSDSSIQGNEAWLKEKKSERNANSTADKMQCQNGSLNRSESLIQINVSRSKEKTSERKSRNANPTADRMQCHKGLLNISNSSIQRNGSWLKKKRIGNNAKPRDVKIQHQEKLLNRSDFLIQGNGSRLKKTTKRNANPKVDRLHHPEGLLNKYDCSIQRNGSRLKRALNTSDYLIQGNGLRLKKRNDRSFNSIGDHVKCTEELLSPHPDYVYDFLKNTEVSCTGNMTLKLPNGTSLEYSKTKEAHDVQRSVHRDTSPFAKGLFDVLSRPADMTGSKNLIYAPSCRKGVQSNRKLSFELKPDIKKTQDLQVHREYKKRLADVLAKPFDLAEYKELYNATKNHKLAQKARNLRSGSKSYNTNDFAPSYLDQFPDFAKQLKNTAFKPEHGLKLLRGFDFWLKNLCHEDAFKPWLPKDTENGKCLILDID